MGSVIGTVTPTNSGGAISSCTASPTLTALTLSQDCQISGTPSSSLSPTTYTITATNSAGSSSAQITISAQSWTAITNSSAPTARFAPSGTWTGSHLIVWGGLDASTLYVLGDGAIYNPSTDSWSAISTTGAPTPRYSHAAIWTGSKLIIWGGWGGNSSAGTGNGTQISAGTDLNDGAMYDLTTNTWTAISSTGAPTARSDFSAVWTGTKMIVWGGDASNDGGSFDPATNSWSAISTSNAPQARSSHTAVWTGSKMVIWGGAATSNGTLLATGGIYNPSTDTWTATSSINTPAGRDFHTAVWTGSKMVVWGGQVSAGDHSTTTGGVYDPSTDSWTSTTTANAPSSRTDHTAIWTGSEMVIWGGFASVSLNDGAMYNPATDTWTPVTTAGVPSARKLHDAVWTGTAMLVWGGNTLADGALFEP